MSNADLLGGNSVQTEDFFTGLAGYQRALTGHMDWLRGWYAAALNWGDGIVAPDCPFDAWYAESGGTVIGSFSGFIALGDIHHEVHEMADRIAARAAQGHTITTSDHEALMGLVLAFGSAAQTLERDVWRTLATVDPLTGLGNRQTMMTHLIGERDRMIRLGQPCCVGLVDIDHFKRVNDTFGHIIGDRVLRAVAETLRCAIRPYDILYRYGGEEFLVCLPAASLEAGAQVLERMRGAVAQLRLMSEAGVPIPVTATFGLASLSADLAVEETVEQADQALYEGKLTGRDRVVVYRPRDER